MRQILTGELAFGTGAQRWWTAIRPPCVNAQVFAFGRSSLLRKPRCGDTDYRGESRSPRHSRRAL